MNKNDFKDKFGYEIEDVESMRQLFKTKRKRKERVWKALDAYDTGEFWDTIRHRLPKHQIIPDTNHIFYVKNNIVNSTYAAPYVADVLPIDPGDQELSRTINKFIQYEYNRHRLGYKQLQIGTRAALVNVGFLQFGWDDTARYTVGGKTNKGEIDVQPRDTLSVLLDPNYSELQDGRAVFILTEDSYESIVSQYPDVKQQLDEAYKNDKKDSEVKFAGTHSQADVGKDYFHRDVSPADEGMLPVYICYKKAVNESGKIRVDQVIYTKNNIILDAKYDYKPSYFPIVPLYDTPPEKDGYGLGVAQRILKNAMTINILDSIATTHVYASQRTPTVLDLRSGLNPDRVARDMNNPDKLFPISDGDPSKALYKLEYPDLPKNLEYIKASLEQAIEKITGIDEKYTGRDTASVTTTGGMERLQSRVSMSDNTRVNMIEKYAKDVTRMMLDFYMHFGGTRYFATNPSYESSESEALELDFDKVANDSQEPHQFAYHIDASPQLPKNRQRLAEAANTIMQVQMQYQGQIELLTPEEWLFFQDFPQKDMILDRMKLDRLREDYDEISSEIASFSAMTEEGMRPEQAVQQLAEERKVKREPSVMKKQLGQK